MGAAGDKHHVTAFRVNEASAAPTPHGQSIPLPTRPIHMTDVPSEHLLVAFSNPSAIRVYRVNPDASPGVEVRQPGPIDAGIYGHQVRVSPDNRLAILVARGHDAAAGKPEEPGALKVFQYRDGLLTDEVSVAPNGGYGFGPRHLDFHPTKPWVYVSLIATRSLDVFGIINGRLSAAPVFRKETLAEPGNIRGRQAAGTSSRIAPHLDVRLPIGQNQRISLDRLSSRVDAHRVCPTPASACGILSLPTSAVEPQYCALPALAPHRLPFSYHQHNLPLGLLSSAKSRTAASESNAASSAYSEKVTNRSPNGATFPTTA